MGISITKAIEILQLNVDAKSPKMDPDVRDTINLAIAARETIHDYRKGVDTELHAPLPGEAVEAVMGPVGKPYP